MTLSSPSLFSFSECLWFLDRGFDECTHRVANGRVRKLFEVDSRKILLEIRHSGESLEGKLLKGVVTDNTELKQIITHWFDLDRHLPPFYELLKKDQDLAFLAQKYEGLRLMAIPCLFETICWSIIGQQINLPFAYKIKRALVEHFGEYCEYENQKYYLFPKPEVIQNADLEVLKVIKLSRQKIDYLLHLAYAFTKGDLSLEKLKSYGTHQEMLKFLMSFRGIGEWTAQYTLMKCLKISQAVPYGDAGLNQALFRLKNIPKKHNRSQLESLFAQYPDWEAYLVFYLWRYLSET
jgi:DNA-3-methyladenine glycosylase II